MFDVDIPKRMQRYQGDANLIRLAVTPGQIEWCDLPTFPAHSKSKDARYRWFVETHGQNCCELDALDPNVLRAFVGDRSPPLSTASCGSGGDNRGRPKWLP